MGRPAPVHHHGGDTGARRRLERRLPAVVDLDQVEQRPHDTIDAAQKLAAPGAQEIAQGALERLGTSGAAMPTLLGLVRRPLRRVRPPRRRVELGRAGRHLALQTGSGLLNGGALVHQQIGPDGRGGVALLERGHPVVQGRHVLLLPGHGPLQGLGAGLHFGE